MFDAGEDPLYIARRVVRMASEDIGLADPQALAGAGEGAWLARAAEDHPQRPEGYGADYEYDHDAPDAFSGQDYWPEKVGHHTLYEPVERGFEREIRKRLDYWARLRKERGEA